MKQKTSAPTKETWFMAIVCRLFFLVFFSFWLFVFRFVDLNYRLWLRVSWVWFGFFLIVRYRGISVTLGSVIAKFYCICFVSDLGGYQLPVCARGFDSNVRAKEMDYFSMFRKMKKRENLFSFHICAFVRRSIITT